MDDPDQVAKRARVLWEKGRNMYGSFFTEIETMRDRLGDEDVFEEWMFRKVGVSLNVAIKASDLLRHLDSLRVKESLRARRVAAATTKPAVGERCLMCGGHMIGLRSTRRYCSDACRKRAQRRAPSGGPKPFSWE